MSVRLIARTGQATGLDVELGQQARLGAAHDVEVRVKAPGVSRQHATILREGEDDWLQDAGSRNGTFVNSRRVSRARLQHLDVITLGRFADLIYLRRDTTAPAAIATAEVESVTLEWLDGPDAGATLEVSPGEMTFGRSAACSVMIDSPIVSKIHAKLEFGPAGVWVQDLQSANGTSVNGHRTTALTMLDTHDTVTIAGSRSFRVIVRRNPAVRRSSGQADTHPTEVFDQEWRTRIVWSPEEFADMMPLPSALAHDAAAVTPQPEAGLAPTPERGDPSAVRIDPVVALRSSAPAPSSIDASPVLLPVGGDALSAAPQPDRGTVAPPAAPPNVPAGVLAAAQSVRTNDTQEPGAGAPPPTGVIDAAARAMNDDSDLETHLGTSIWPIVTVSLSGPAGSFDFESGSFTIGRAADAHVSLDSREVSRHHATLIVSTDEVVVDAANTANGTFVNGDRVHGTRRLEDGDRLGIAGFEFQIAVVRAPGRLPS